MIGDTFTILGLGEVLWDIYEDGKALGGAPFNFAYHVSQLGHDGIPLSRVGEDRLGDQILSAAEELGIPTDCIQRDPEHPTGTVQVKLETDGTPDFTIVEEVAWDYMDAEDGWLRLAGRCDALCFGTLAQRSEHSRRAIRQVLQAAEGALSVCDLNFRMDFYSRSVVTESLASCDVLKLNEEEVNQLRRLLQAGPAGPHGPFLRQLMADYDMQMVCVTLGRQGCRILTPEETVSRPVPPAEVVDTVGSGDAFGAGLVAKYLEGASPEAVADAANLLGAFVATRRGATPALSDEVVERFSGL